MHTAPRILTIILLINVFLSVASKTVPIQAYPENQFNLEAKKSGITWRIM